YTAAEYPHKMTWGHTPAEWAVDYALAAGARRLALFHHDPLRDDEAVDRLVDVCRQRVLRAGGTLEVFAAAEGQTLELTAVEGAAARPLSSKGLAVVARGTPGPRTGAAAGAGAPQRPPRA